MINSYLVQQIKGNFLYKTTLEQEKAVKFLADFLFSRQSDSVFLLICCTKKLLIIIA